MRLTNKYAKNYPMTTLQIALHKRAMRRTQEHFLKEKGWRLSFNVIEGVLICVHIYIKFVAKNLHKWSGPKDPQTINLGFGRLRLNYVKLFEGMYRNGELTKEEYKVIKEELYKDAYDKYNEIIQNKKQWKKQQRLKKLRRSVQQ